MFWCSLFFGLFYFDDDLDTQLARLNHRSFQTRESATEALSRQPPEAIKRLIVAQAATRSPEVRLRLSKVVKKILGGASLTDLQSVFDVLQMLEEQPNENGKSLAVQYRQGLGQVDSIGIARAFRKRIKDARKMRETGESHPDVIESSFVDTILDSDDFRLIKGKSKIPSSFHSVRDTSANPRILIYRICWFNGGWSRWFIPGINDPDSKVEGERMWRYFSSHTYEYIEIQPELGPLSNRNSIIAEKADPEKR